MAGSLEATGLWDDAIALPDTLQATVERATGFTDVGALLAAPGTRRVVATGNGAAYYVAVTLWLASLERPHERLAVVAVPAGVLAADRFAWRDGDVLLVVSSSGELRDVIEALERGAPSRYAAVTSSPESSIASGAEATAVVDVHAQRAVTHTQAYCGNVAAVLTIWAELTDDRVLARALRNVPAAVARGLAEAPEWAGAVVPDVPPAAAIAFGTGSAWAAALEAALLLKEVAGVPSEGLETREGATSGMYALAPGHMAVSIPTRDDRLVAEAERVCAAKGATVVRVPRSDTVDARMAALTGFPALLALAAMLGLRAGLDVDSPAWTDAYYATARVNRESEET